MPSEERAVLLIALACTPVPEEFDPTTYADTPACTETGTDVGQCAPDFSLTDATGTTRSLSDYDGLTVMADFSGFS